MEWKIVRVVWTFFLIFVLFNTEKSKFEMLKRLSKQDECININIFFFSYLLFVVYIYSEVKEAVEKVVEDVHENAPLVPTEAVEEVKAPAAAVEEEPKKPETAEKTETDATEKKTEDLPAVENGNGEAEVVSAEEPAPEVPAGK